MDIRQMFRKATQAHDKTLQTKTAHVINDEDEDDFKATKGKRMTRSRKIKYEFDSDEDEVPIKKSRQETSKSKRKSRTDTVSDFFSAPIKRSDVKPTGRSIKKSSPDVILESSTDSIVLSPHKDTKPPSTDALPPAKKLKLLVDQTTKTQLKPVKAPSPIKLELPQQQSPRKSARRHDTPEKITKKKTEQATPPSARERKQSSTTPPRAPKLNRSESYIAYLAREGPKALGSKEIPQGAVNCLAGLTFVFTGVGVSLDKDKSTDLVQQYGGRVTSAISRKTTHLVAGEGAGESKQAKAKQFGTKIINEDDFLELIRSKPAKGGVTTPTSSKTSKKGKTFSSSQYSGKRELIVESTEERSEKRSRLSPNESQSQNKQSGNRTQSRNEARLQSQDTAQSSSIVWSASETTVGTKGNSNLMWVDKYSPVTTDKIIGQKGDRSNVKKLAKWLREWFDYNGVKPTKKIHYDNKDGLSFKAALLSGPPGIGKTTSATLVCKEEGFSFTEMNASSCRGKSRLQSEIAGSLGSLTMDAFITGGGGAEAGKNHVLIMDEVDGMAGNEDRGGMQELIKLIKNSSIPVICICNDRQHTKIRSLANYCYDLRFHKPKLEQIKGLMMSVAFKEGIKINPQALQEIIIASNNDIRQAIHSMSLWTATSGVLSVDEAMKTGKKEFKMGPFDVVKSVFMPVKGDRELSLNEKAGLFFQDYSFIPLFVQENYLRVKSQSAKNTKDLLQRMSDSADSIAKGDLVSKLIRAQSHWGLLPVQAMYSSVLPGEYMRGTMGRPEFPQWLGNNSKQGKYGRILQELQLHTRLVCSCDRTELIMDYLPLLQNRMTHPLMEKGSEGVPEVVSLLESYDMTREDWENMVELGKYSGMNDVLTRIDTKTKSAFTRAYNKSAHVLPYQSQQNILKKKSRVSSITEEIDEVEEGSLSEEEEGESQQVADKFLVKPKKMATKSTENKKKNKRK